MVCNLFDQLQQRSVVSVSYQSLPSYNYENWQSKTESQKIAKDEIAKLPKVSSFFTPVAVGEVSSVQEVNVGLSDM